MLHDKCFNLLSDILIPDLLDEFEAELNYTALVFVTRRPVTVHV